VAQSSPRSIVEGIVVYGEIINGNKLGGKRSVKVVGQIKDKNRIEGQWVWDEVTAESGNIPECAGKSYSFSASVEIPRGFKFTGNEHRSE
jgi:hypothetical protein